MPEFVEFSPITAGEAEARADLVLVPHDSAAMRGRRTIAGERKAPRQVLFQVVLAVSCRNPPLKRVAKRMKEQGKLHSVAIIAIGRRLITIADAFLKTGENGRHQVR